MLETFIGISRIQVVSKIYSRRRLRVPGAGI